MRVVGHNGEPTPGARQGSAVNETIVSFMRASGQRGALVGDAQLETEARGRELVMKLTAVIFVAALGLVGLAGCGGSNSSSGDACAKGVDALNDNIATVTNSSQISASIAHHSLASCDLPGIWKISAGVDKIGEQLGALNDQSGAPTLDAGTGLGESGALNSLCSHYDPGDSTGSCQGRNP
jgi:hypothetical protein